MFRKVSEIFEPPVYGGWAAGFDDSVAVVHTRPELRLVHQIAGGHMRMSFVHVMLATAALATGCGTPAVALGSSVGQPKWRIPSPSERRPGQRRPGQPDAKRAIHGYPEWHGDGHAVADPPLAEVLIVADGERDAPGFVPPRGSSSRQLCYGDRRRDLHIYRREWRHADSSFHRCG